MIHIPEDILPKELQKKRVIVFIDGNHLFHRMEKHFHTHNISILSLSKSLANSNRNLVEIRYYYTPFKQHLNPQKYQEQQKYTEQIKASPNTVMILGKYIKKPILFKESIMKKLEGILTKEELQTYVEKGIDVNIAVDMIQLATDDKYDVAILLSGDSDFVPAITQVRKNHKEVQVTAFKNTLNSCNDLIEASNSFINLFEHIPEFHKYKVKEP